MQTFDDQRDADDCVRGLNGEKIGNSNVRVELGRNRGGGSAGPRGGGGGGGGYGGGGGGGYGDRRRCAYPTLAILDPRRLRSAPLVSAR